MRRTILALAALSTVFSIGVAQPSAQAAKAATVTPGPSATPYPTATPDPDRPREFTYSGRSSVAEVRCYTWHDQFQCVVVPLK